MAQDHNDWVGSKPAFAASGNQARFAPNHTLTPRRRPFVPSAALQVVCTSASVSAKAETCPSPPPRRAV